MIIWGIIFIIAGIATVNFTQHIYNFTGKIDFIESHFPGNTFSFIKLIGVILVLVGIFMVTGLFGFITKPISDALNNIFGGLK